MISAYKAKCNVVRYNKIASTECRYRNDKVVKSLMNEISGKIEEASNSGHCSIDTSIKDHHLAFKEVDRIASKFRSKGFRVVISDTYHSLHIEW